MATIRRIGPLSLAKLQALVCGALGLIAGVLYSVGGLFVDLLTTGLNAGSAMAFGALVAMPALAAAAGFAAGLVEALIFNLMAPKIGGINLELDSG